MGKNPRINVTYDQATYDAITKLAAKKNMDRSELVRNWSLDALNGNLAVENLGLITRIIREQLQDVLDPNMNRLATISSKACIQAATATYLNAEAILKFVPSELQEEVEDTYEKARKKAIIFAKSPINLDL